MAPEEKSSTKVTFEVMVIVEVPAGVWEAAQVEHVVMEALGRTVTGFDVLEVSAR